ncbi:hypothetical protein [Mesorhizobium qingshengii]|uniref:Uncharacterized protein n=1 Tax=Mesorhizobium qingshengii TaxID=1165689 RepID=A0A1G5YGX1_9HYPH|nr:hypothetical protein [Mesorhizobium qingshengii]SDA81650.1 hypothetical protein SAMN02927914_03295 [Mesorhizobium qingshengii]
MRQRLLNGALAGALAALFCLLAATAYTEVKQDDAEASCASADHTLGQQAARCGNCLVATYDSCAVSVSNCGGRATCAIDGKVVDRAPKSKQIESRPWALVQMQP